MDMEWLNSSIGEYMKGGSLPCVPEQLRLEQCMYAPVRHPRAAVLAKNFLHGNPWAAKDMERIHLINDISSFSAYFWPNSTDDSRALTLIKYSQWIFCVDNVVDDLDCLQADKLCHRLRHHIFDSGAYPPTARSDSHIHIEKEPLIISIGLEWWKEVQANSSRKQQARFAAVFRKYLRYQAALTHMREKCQHERSLPGLEEYMLLRRYSSGFHTALALVEYEVGIELDEETYKSPILTELLVAAMDQMAGINDILSFPTEFGYGEVLNLLPVLHLRNNKGRAGKADQVPFPVAVSQAWQMVKEQERDVARLAQQLRQSLMSSQKMTPALEKYVESVCTTLPGSWEWMLHSPRYKLNPLTPSSPTSTTITTKACIYSNFKYRSPLLSPLPFSPFKSPSHKVKALPFAPKLWKFPLLPPRAKGSFSFPPM